MIRFHKVLQANLPASVEQNQEHVWFTDQGAVYVADGQGVPRQMGLGFQIVSAVPNGIPAAPGLMRYSTTSQKYYFSTATQWVELMTAAQAGSSGGPGYASGVIVTDSNNNFTSGDVEGALLELANALKPVMGTKTLPDFSGNVFGNDEAGEWGLLSSATNRPAGSTTQAWLMQRQTSDGSLMGFVIDKNGNMFIRYGDSYKKVATGNDTGAIEDDIGNIDSSLSSLSAKVEGMRLYVGDGLAITNNKLTNNPTITLSSSAYAPFVRKTGSEMTGDLTFQNSAGLAFDTTTQNLIDFYSREVGSARMQIRNGAEGFRLADVSSGTSPLFWKNTDKRLYINYLNTDGTLMEKGNSKGVVMQAPLLVEREPIRTTPSRYPDENPANHYAAYFDNKLGNMQISRGENAAFAVRNPRNQTVKHVRLETTNQLHSEAERTSMALTGIHGHNMEHLQVNAHGMTVRNDLHVGGLFVVGSDTDWAKGRGHVHKNNRVVLHARTGRNLNAPTSVDQRYVAQMSFYRHERDRDEIHFNVADMGNFLYDTSGWQGHTVTVTANRFRGTQFENASSIKYKENIEKYDDGALGIVENLDVFKYNYKEHEDKKQTVGFIIEKGVPEIAITGAGDALDPYAMTAILWKAVKELKAEVDELRRK